jgi:FAD/FMN-containing dehydrogenase
MPLPNPILKDLSALLDADGLVTVPDILKRYKSDWLVKPNDL